MSWLFPSKFGPFSIQTLRNKITTKFFNVKKKLSLADKQQAIVFNLKLLIKCQSYSQAYHLRLTFNIYFRWNIVTSFSFTLQNDLMGIFCCCCCWCWKWPYSKFIHCSEFRYSELARITISAPDQISIYRYIYAFELVKMLVPVFFKLDFFYR